MPIKGATQLLWLASNFLYSLSYIFYYLHWENLLYSTCIINCQLNSTDSGVEATLEDLSLEVALAVTSMDLVVDVVGQVGEAVVAEEWVAEVDFATRAGVEEVVVILG